LGIQKKDENNSVFQVGAGTSREAQKREQRRANIQGENWESKKENEKEECI
jgi:nitrate/TMAO reductase-like tetraheme cytochrome c subunit